MSENVLHTDSEGYRVVRRSDGKVIYERYPDKEYEYLTAEQAAERILRGEELEGCYIEVLSVDAFKSVYSRMKEDYETGKMSEADWQKVKDAFEEEGEIELEVGGDVTKHRAPKLDRPITCNDSLIGTVNFQKLFITQIASFVRTRFFDEAKFFAVVFTGAAVFQEATFNSYANFRMAIFSVEANFCEANFFGRANFSGAKFSDGVSFSQATFSDRTRFFETTFSARTDFALANFNDVTEFGKAVFGGETDFWRATFSGKAVFGEATFSSSVDFREVIFCDETIFWEAIFNNVTNFEAAKFNGDTFFWGTAFNGRTYFQRVKFGGETHFNEAIFGDIVTFGGTYFLTVDFEHARFERACNMSNFAVGNLDLRRTVFTEDVFIIESQGNRSEEKENTVGLLQARIEKIAKEIREKDEEKELEWLNRRRSAIESLLKLLSRWKDSDRGIEAVNFEDTLVQGELRCDFKYLVPRKRGFRKWEPVILPHRIAEGVEGPPKGEEKESSYWWEEAQKQYAWLKEQYRKQGRYEDEDKAHWWASECARRTHGAIDPRRYLKFLFYKWIAGYGVNPWNIVKTICVVFVIFALLFGTVFYGKLCYEGKPLPADDGFWTRAGNALYFSGITYATIGYGDISPVGIARLLAVVEGLLGIILNAALIVVIFRKIIR